MDDGELRSSIKAYMLENFLFGDAKAELKDDASFLEGGIVDSTGVLLVVEFLQDTWKIKVEDAEMVPENLDTVDNLVGFLRRKLAA